VVQERDIGGHSLVWNTVKIPSYPENRHIEQKIKVVDGRNRATGAYPDRDYPEEEGSMDNLGGSEADVARFLMSPPKNGRLSASEWPFSEKFI